ncbi:MAG TPA: pyridoxamine 5'-phosphate oxidase family protein [Candidatus Methylomirabilis sp.]|nr:pyridoxamine 5'-phosphate oxidase family protein [Candidatus Methylomirabilis sp.]
MILERIKNIIEKNPVVVATVMGKNNPNAVAVAFVKVVNGKILITDNFMNQTVKDIKKNNRICLLVWNKKWQGYKIIGREKYYASGKWKKFVEKMKENKKLPAKGAILVTPLKIIKLA